MPPLVPCADCRRHIRVDHTTCPFCSSVVPDNFASRVVPPARKRLDRLAMFSFATTLAVAACGEIEPQPAPGTGAPQSGQADAGSAQDAAAAERDARAAEDAARDAGLVDDDGGVMAKYGAPPLDGGFEDDGGISADYGQPPVDASAD